MVEQTEPARPGLFPARPGRSAPLLRADPAAAQAERQRLLFIVVVALFIPGTLQSGIVLVRKFLPPDQGAQAQDIFEMIADGTTVLSFALGVFGTIGRMPDSI